MLNDLEIREALVEHLKFRSIRPKAIMEELQVCNGKAIADVVALHSEAHCYEIKGQNDKIERIIAQGAFYNSSFRKITLVTTENHLIKAQSIAPSHWGLMLATNSGDAVRIKYVKKACINPHFDAMQALLTLWKSEMLDILEGKHKNKPRDFLAQMITQTKDTVDLGGLICDRLLNRYSTLQTI